MKPLIGRKVKAATLHAACDLLGSKRSMTTSRNVDIERTDMGVIMTSKNTGRIIEVFGSNLQAIEYFPEEQTESSVSKTKRVNKDATLG